MFTGSSRQTTLVSSEGGSVDNIGYKRRNSRRSQRSFKQEKTMWNKNNRTGLTISLFIYSLHLSSVVHIESPLLLCT